MLQPRQPFLGFVVVPPPAAVRLGLGDHTPHDGLPLAGIAGDLALNGLVLFCDEPITVILRQNNIGKPNAPGRQDDGSLVNHLFFLGAGRVRRERERQFVRSHAGDGGFLIDREGRPASAIQDR